MRLSRRKAYGAEMAKWVTRSDLQGYQFAASILCSDEPAAVNQGSSRTVDDHIEWLTCAGECVSGFSDHRSIHRNGLLVGHIDLTNEHPRRGRSVRV
jgi:hypothetical protein